MVAMDFPLNFTRGTPWGGRGAGWGGGGLGGRGLGGGGVGGCPNTKSCFSPIRKRGTSHIAIGHLKELFTTNQIPL